MVLIFDLVVSLLYRNPSLLRTVSVKFSAAKCWSNQSVSTQDPNSGPGGRGMVCFRTGRPLMSDESLCVSK